MDEKPYQLLDETDEVREPLTVHYPMARKIRLVTDNLNTHVVSSLYEAFDAETAGASAERTEIHYTPNQNMVVGLILQNVS